MYAFFRIARNVLGRFKKNVSFKCWLVSICLQIIFKTIKNNIQMLLGLWSIELKSHHSVFMRRTLFLILLKFLFIYLLRPSSNSWESLDMLNDFVLVRIKFLRFSISVVSPIIEILKLFCYIFMTDIYKLNLFYFIFAKDNNLLI